MLFKTKSLIRYFGTSFLQNTQQPLKYSRECKFEISQKKRELIQNTKQNQDNHALFLNHNVLPVKYNIDIKRLLVYHSIILGQHAFLKIMDV